jgi:2-keto-4-pentenoate hydratase/2-oxohepta-3-ene-1,7-dioic acid hydratase in catechol pathway
VRIARFAAGGEVFYGLVGTAREGHAAPGGQVIAELAGHPFGGQDSTRLTGTTYPLADVRLLAPVLPSKVIAFEMASHGLADGDGGGTDGGTVMYLKPSTAVCGPSDAIRYPAALTHQVAAEGELAVVIGRLCRQVPASQAAGVIFGYTCATDVTARDLQARDGQWARAKGFDTFCPLGPWIETSLDTGDLELTTAVNGEVSQRGRTSQVRGGVPALVAYASNVMTLLPGDVLLTGAPAATGTGPAGTPGPLPTPGLLEPGDEVSVTIEGIGTLTNKVDKGD